MGMWVALLNVLSSEMGPKALKTSFVLVLQKMEATHATHLAMESVMGKCHGARH